MLSIKLPHYRQVAFLPPSVPTRRLTVRNSSAGSVLSRAQSHMTLSRYGAFLMESPSSNGAVHTSVLGSVGRQ